MRPFLAEIRKLHRPMTYWLAAIAVLFCVLDAWAGAVSVSLHPTDVGAATDAAGHLAPAAAGTLVAGLTASLPGAVIIALLAGAHVGAEWTGRTMKNLLVQCGFRARVLAAKAVSLWVAVVAIMAACWAALAAAGPLLTAAYHLPGVHQAGFGPLRHSGGQFGRATLVVAVFAVLAILAAVATRSTIGTIVGTVGVVLGMVMLASQPRGAALSPANWVQGWMGFTGAGRTRETIVTYFWSSFSYQDGSTPAVTTGLVGLAASAVGAAATAAVVFHRTDITG